jgi:hypothetical protein
MPELNIAEWQVSDWVAVVSAAISVLALLLNIVITSRQTKVSVEALKFNNDSQVMSWANRTVAAMSEAQHICASPNVSALYMNERGIALATSLSSLIDEGRWFFPNMGRRPTDPEKPGAYRGTRQPILDYVFSAYEAVHEMMRAEDAPRETLAAKIGEAKRHFVSEVQHAVDPRRRAWVMDRFRKY